MRCESCSLAVVNTQNQSSGACGWTIPYNILLVRWIRMYDGELECYSNLYETVGMNLCQGCMGVTVFFHTDEPIINILERRVIL